MVFSWEFWCLFAVSLAISAIGFKNYVWFISLGYGFSIAGEGILMLILFGKSLTSVLTPLSSATLLVFSLLYTPCVAAVASIRRELGLKWGIGVVIWQCVVAWIVALLVRTVLMLVGVA